MTAYFYDSYALIEFIKGNIAYQSYFLEFEGFTSFYNLLEVYYSLLKTDGPQKAKQAISFLKPLLLQPILEDIESSMNFRLLHKDKKLSYTDCLGYILAKRRKLKFLTGDEGFKALPNVEFIK